MISTKYRYEISYNGVPLKVLKSALQKYIRRKNIKKAVWCLVEMDLFSTVNDTRSKSIRTNMINRLIAIMSEDIGVANPFLPIHMKTLYLKWTAERDSDISRQHLLDMVSHLLEGKRIRLVSDYKSVFLLPPYYLKDQVQLEYLHRRLLNEYPNIYRDHYLKQFDIWELLDKKDVRVFIEISRTYPDKNKEICDYLLENTNGKVKECIEALLFFYKKMKHKEKPIYFYQAVQTYLFQDKIEELKWMGAISRFKKFNVKQCYQKNLSKKKIKFDNFVYDVHTGDKKTLEQFSTEGTVVKDESKQFFNPVYREIYNNFKLLLDRYHRKEIYLGTDVVNISKELEKEITKLPQGQKRTATFKKACYIYQDVVVKGPYQNLEKIDINIKNTVRLADLEDRLNLPKKLRSILPWHCIYKCQKRYYLVAKNVGNIQKMEYQVESSKIEKDVKIVKRGSMVSRVSEEELKWIEELEEDLSEDIIVASLQHLYLRYLYGIGDSGTHNILVATNLGEQLIVGNDMEEFRKTKYGKTKLECLFRKVSKKIKKVYSPYLDKIVTFSQPIGIDEVDAKIEHWNDF